MQGIVVDDKDEIGLFLRKNVPLHIYELGDLDDFYWPHTTWYAFREGSRLRTLVLLYTAEPVPVLLALCEDEEIPLQEELVRSISPLLPPCFYAHLTPGLETVLSHGYVLT
jgi:hypothetical protein